MSNNSETTNSTKVNTETEFQLKDTFVKGLNYTSIAKNPCRDIVIDSIAIQKSNIALDNAILNPKFQHCFW